MNAASLIQDARSLPDNGSNGRPWKLKRLHVGCRRLVPAEGRCSLTPALHLLKSVSLTKTRQGAEELSQLEHSRQASASQTQVYTISAGANNWLLILRAAANVGIAST